MELVGNDDERKRQLEGLKQAVGSKAGEYLYPNAEKNKDGNETGRFFVGVLGGGPSGKGPDFASINGASEALFGVIADPQIAQVRIVEPGQPVNFFGNQQASLNSNVTGLTSSYNANPPIKIWVLDPSNHYNDLAPTQMENGQPGSRSFSDNLMHELGHAAWQMDQKAGRLGPSDPAGNQRAVDFENFVRLRQGTGRRSDH